MATHATEHSTVKAHSANAGHVHSDAPASHGGHGAHTGHVVGPPVLLATGFALLVLTVVTVAAVLVDFGAVINLWIAMLIATVKAALVALYFMHLRYDRPINAIVFVASLIFVALFVVGTITDSDAYRPYVQWREAAFYKQR